MKVCPKCQASFSEETDEFVYCPHDHTPLVRYDLRAALRRRQQQELSLLLPTMSFGERLARELAFALRELRRHPLLFVRELLRGEGTTRQRIYMLQSGAAAAVMAYTLIVASLIWWGVAYGLPSVSVVTAHPRPAVFEEVMILPIPPKTKSEFTRGSKGHLGGSLTQPQRAHGGGGGGAEEKTPASQGVLPRATLTHQIVLPDPHPPKIDTVKLVVAPVILADQRSVPILTGPTGIPEAPSTVASKGPGKDGGMGNQNGTGVGPGIGAGGGPGRKYNIGDGAPVIGGKDPTGSGDREDIPLASGSMRPTILYREKARYTEDARADKVQGAVILLATFTADGRITNIRVLKGLPQGLTQEAIKAAQHIRFNPATRNGVPVTVQARLEYNFSLY